MTLHAILDTLIPGDADWPPGHTVAETILPETRSAFETLAAALPPDFQPGDEPALQHAAAAHPAAFERAITEAYTAYYTAPEIRAVIERLTGYEARPPQPEGYTLPPFDPTLLQIQISRPAFWRPTPP